MDSNDNLLSSTFGSNKIWKKSLSSGFRPEYTFDSTLFWPSSPSGMEYFGIDKVGSVEYFFFFCSI